VRRPEQSAPYRQRACFAHDEFDNAIRTPTKTGMRLTRRTALATVLTPFSRTLYAQAQQAKPNIVFILMDNLGYGEVGVYGGGVTRGAPHARKRARGGGGG